MNNFNKFFTYMAVGALVMVLSVSCGKNPAEPEGVETLFCADSGTTPITKRSTPMETILTILNKRFAFLRQSIFQSILRLTAAFFDSTTRAMTVLMQEKKERKKAPSNPYRLQMMPFLDYA